MSNTGSSDHSTLITLNQLLTAFGDVTPSWEVLHSLHTWQKRMCDEPVLTHGALSIAVKAAAVVPLWERRSGFYETILSLMESLCLLPNSERRSERKPRKNHIDAVFVSQPEHQTTLCAEQHNIHPLTPAAFPHLSAEISWKHGDGNFTSMEENVGVESATFLCLQFYAPATTETKMMFPTKRNMQSHFRTGLICTWDDFNLTTYLQVAQAFNVHLNILRILKSVIKQLNVLTTRYGRVQDQT